MFLQKWDAPDKGVPKTRGDPEKYPSRVKPGLEDVLKVAKSTST